MSTLPDFENEFERLTPDQQDQVLEFVRQLRSNDKDSQEKEERRKAILELAGSIPQDDIERMKAAIEEGCEQVNPDGW